MGSYNSGVEDAAAATPSGTTQFNTKWTRPTVSTIKVEPHDTDQKAYISLSEDGEDPILVEVPGAGLTWDITDTGAIGGTRGAAEAANTGYELYCVAKADGADPALISEVNKTALTYAALAAVDADYVLKSAVVSCGANDSGSNLLEYYQVNGAASFEDRQQLLPAAGKATSNTQVTTVERFVPSKAALMTMGVNGAHWSGGAKSCRLYAGAAATGGLVSVDNLGSDGWCTSQAVAYNEMPVLGDDPEASVWYKWSATPDTGAYFYVTGWKL